MTNGVGGSTCRTSRGTERLAWLKKYPRNRDSARLEQDTAIFLLGRCVTQAGPRQGYIGPMNANAGEKHIVHGKLATHAHCLSASLAWMRPRDVASVGPRVVEYCL